MNPNKLCVRCKHQCASPIHDDILYDFDFCIKCRVKIKRHFRKWLQKQVEKWKNEIQYFLMKYIDYSNEIGSCCNGGEWVIVERGGWDYINSAKKVEEGLGHKVKILEDIEW